VLRDGNSKREQESDTFLQGVERGVEVTIVFRLAYRTHPTLDAKSDKFLMVVT
jgi:hypothetical protein